MQVKNPWYMSLNCKGCKVDLIVKDIDVRYKMQSKEHHKADGYKKTLQNQHWYIRCIVCSEETVLFSKNESPDIGKDGTKQYEEFLLGKELPKYVLKMAEKRCTGKYHASYASSWEGHNIWEIGQD